MILLKLDRRDKVPLHEQITLQIQRLIEQGSLPLGSALSPTRVLATQLGVHRTTVCRAYEELWALGYIEGRPGSYTRVRARPALARRDEKAGRGILHWESRVSAPSQAALEFCLGYDVGPPPGGSLPAIDFRPIEVDPRLIPVDTFRRCLNAVLHREGAGILRYPPYAGYPPLRRSIAQRLQVHGIAITEEEVLITNGSQHGLDLVLRLLTQPGAVAAVEAPTYSLMLPLLRLHQVRPLEVPMLRDGMDLEFLQRALEHNAVSFVYTMPNFQNPTGISTAQAHRERLLALCEHHGVPLVEDGFEEEMKYFGRVALPIKSMDGNQIVIYLGTFSKVLMPGVRIGWVVAHRECVQRLMAIRRIADLSTGAPLQAGLEEFCRAGFYDLHLRRLHRVFRKRMQVTLSALREHMPRDGVTWTEPEGGYLLWVELPDSRKTCAEVFEHLGRRGVAVCPGHQFFAAPPTYPCFRLCVATLDEAQIVEGVRRLGLGLKELLIH